MCLNRIPFKSALVRVHAKLLVGRQMALAVAFRPGSACLRCTLTVFFQCRSCQWAVVFSIDTQEMAVRMLCATKNLANAFRNLTISNGIAKNVAQNHLLSVPFPAIESIRSISFLNKCEYHHRRNPNLTKHFPSAGSSGCDMQVPVLIDLIDFSLCP